MRSFFRIFRFAIVLAIVCLCVIGGEASALDSAPESEVAAKAPSVSLSVSVIMDQSPTRLIFTVKNLSKQDFSTTPIGTNDSRIKITTPDGKVVEYFVWKDGIQFVTIPSFQSHSWEVDIGPIMQASMLEAPGSYEIRWVIDKQQSNSLLLQIIKPKSLPVP